MFGTLYQCRKCKRIDIVTKAEDMKCKECGNEMKGMTIIDELFGKKKCRHCDKTFRLLILLLWHEGKYHKEKFVNY